MASPSIQFKKLVLKLDSVDRATVVSTLSRWANGIKLDPKAPALSSFLQQLESRCFYEKKDLENDFMLWQLSKTLDDCVSFQQVVKSKLAIPKNNIDEMLKKEEEKKTEKPVKHKAIPKKTREALWTVQFGDSTKGGCYCCKAEITALGTWHAGHVVAQSNGGADTVDNLRAICLPCNLAMGSEHMDEFKNRCYPPEPAVQAPRIMCATSKHHAFGKH
jgi:5-methylcytosine-specific restriction endonuclease McrA